MTGFNEGRFAEQVRKLAKRHGRLRVEEVTPELCPVDVVEAGHFLEGIHLKDADHVFDLTVDNLNTMLQDMKEAA